MFPPALQKITTEYIAIEDRIRLSGEHENGEQAVIWLTQRLLRRLLPRLIQMLEGKSSDKLGAEIMQGFAQQAAQSKLVPQQPVQLQADSISWVACSVDFVLSGPRISMIFRDLEGHSASLILSATPLRQWLNILYIAYMKAGWEREVWPLWFQQSIKQAPREMVVLH